MAERDQDSEDMAKAKKVWAETGDGAAAFKCLSQNRKPCIERRLLSGLMRDDKDFVGALDMVSGGMETSSQFSKSE